MGDSHDIKHCPAPIQPGLTFAGELSRLPEATLYPASDGIAVVIPERRDDRQQDWVLVVEPDGARYALDHHFSLNEQPFRVLGKRGRKCEFKFAASASQHVD